MSQYLEWFGSHISKAKDKCNCPDSMDSNLPILHCSCNGWVCIALNIQMLDSLYWEQEVFWATAEVIFKSIGQVYGYFISDRVFHSLFRFLEISGELLLTPSLETGECRAYLGFGRCVILNFVFETFQLLQILVPRTCSFIAETFATLQLIKW